MDELDIEKIKEGLCTNFIGQKILYYNEVESTNIVAKSLAKKEPKNNGTVIIAESQTQGKGRQNKSWKSPKFTGVWMSIILRPQFYVKEILQITSLVGLAVQKAINKSSGLDTFIKWPNDIIVNKKKVCGILVESIIRGEEVDSVIIGIGVNVNQDIECFDGLEHASSLKIEKQEYISREDIVKNILYFLENEYNNFIKAGKINIQQIKEASILLDKKVKIFDDNEEIVAQVVDFLKDGSMLIKDESSKYVNIRSYNKSIRGLNSYLD